MADSFNTSKPPSASVGGSSAIVQDSAVTKQTVGNNFSEKLAQFGGAVMGQLGNGVATVAGAIGFTAGRSAGAGLATLGSNLSQFGTTNAAQISSQVHGLSNATNAQGGAAVASGPGVQSTPSFGAGTSGPGGIAQRQAAFGAGATSLGGLDATAGLSAGGASVGGAVGGSTTSAVGGAIGSAAGGDGQAQLMNATKQMQETQMSFNLQYLQLQSQMQAENRSYTAVSNIMKTKHDTVKNSISNVR